MLLYIKKRQLHSRLTRQEPCLFMRAYIWELYYSYFIILLQYDIFCIANSCVAILFCNGDVLTAIDGKEAAMDSQAVFAAIHNASYRVIHGVPLLFTASRIASFIPVFLLLLFLALVLLHRILRAKGIHIGSITLRSLSHIRIHTNDIDVYIGRIWIVFGRGGRIGGLWRLQIDHIRVELPVTLDESDPALEPVCFTRVVHVFLLGGIGYRTG